MKYLYIIGNGFDIFSGLKTRFVDFRFWLEHHYPFVFENLYDAFDIDGDWWYDFERHLGETDYKKFVSKFDPSRKARDKIFEEVEKRKELEENNNILYDGSRNLLDRPFYSAFGSVVCSPSLKHAQQL